MAVQYHYVPRPPLSAFIESFWLYDGERPSHTIERRLPDGLTSLVINLHEDRTRIYDGCDQDRFHDTSGSVISGPHSRVTLLDTRSVTSAIGVTFRPGGVLPFLPFPASELHGEILSLETLWGTEAAELRGRLCKATMPAVRVAILERFLLARLDPSKEGHPAVACAVRTLEDTVSAPTVASTAENIGLSQTRLIQVFREAVGLTPKQYARLRRLQHALRLLDTGRVMTWGDVVVGCGYFDQSHLIHDFQALAGLSPSAYLAARGEHRNHVPLPV